MQYLKGKWTNLKLRYGIGTIRDVTRCQHRKIKTKSLANLAHQFSIWDVLTGKRRWLYKEGLQDDNRTSLLIHKDTIPSYATLWAHCNKCKHEFKHQHLAGTPPKCKMATQPQSNTEHIEHMCCNESKDHYHSIISHRKQQNLQCQKNHESFTDTGIVPPTVRFKFAIVNTTEARNTKKSRKRRRAHGDIVHD